MEVTVQNIVRKVESAEPEAGRKMALGLAQFALICLHEHDFDLPTEKAIELLKSAGFTAAEAFFIDTRSFSVLAFMLEEMNRIVVHIGDEAAPLARALVSRLMAAEEEQPTLLDELIAAAKQTESAEKRILFDVRPLDG